VSRSVKAHALLILISLIWGANFVIIKYCLRDISPLFLNAIRMTLAATVLAIIFRRELPRITWKATLSSCIVGVFLFLGNELQTTGLVYTTPSKSAFLTGVSIVLVPLLLWVFWRRSVSLGTGTGVALAFIGLYLLTIPTLAGSGLNLSSMNHGDLLTLLSAVVFAFQIILLGRYTQTHPWRQITVLQVAVTALLMIVTVPVAEKVSVTWTPAVIAGIIVTSLFSLAFAFAIQAWAQQFTPPTHTALIFSMEPVFAWLISFIFLGERLGLRAGIGALLILAGVVISTEKDAIASMAGESSDKAASVGAND
jgi:drug/metabolite transporter (DMT)-like permease